jgi:serine protease
MKQAFRLFMGFWGLALLITPLLAQQRPSVPLSFQLAEGAEVWEGKLILKIRPEFRAQCSLDDLHIASLRPIINELGVSEIKAIFPTHFEAAAGINYRSGGVDLSLLYELDYDTARYSVEAAVSRFFGQEAISYVEPWYIHQLFYQPNDYYADTSGINGGSWHLGVIQAREAWDLQRNDTSIVIGIIDSGASFDHPDMQDNLQYNLADWPDGIDNDEDGYVDNYRGWDFAGDSLGRPGDSDPSTIFPWHGVGVAGAAAATADNFLGGVGTGFNCRYLPVKAAPESNIGNIYYGYQGVVYAVDQGCQIVNLSWGSPARSRFGEDVINYAALSRGVAVICAGGNTFTDIQFFPAGYPNAISVGISGQGDSVCCNSSFHYSMDMTAPGINIVSPQGIDNYVGWQGSSVSAPVVAGAVAITLGYFPQLNGFQAAHRVRVTTDKIPFEPFMSEKVGSGRLNMFRALHDDPLPSVRVQDYALEDPNGDGRPDGGDTVIFNADFANLLAATQNLEVQISIPLHQQPFVQVLEENFFVGSLNTWQEVNSGSQFQLRISPAIPLDLHIDLKITYRDTSQNYQDFEYVSLRLNPTWLDVTENKLHTSINSRGNFGYDDFFGFNAGLGVSFQKNRNVLAEGGFLVGTSGTRVANRIRSHIQNLRDNDFRILEIVQPVPDPYLSDFEAKGSFDDAFGNSNLGLDVHQTTFAWQKAPYDQFVIFLYELQNQSTGPVGNVYAGMFADFNLITQTLIRNRCAYDTANRVIYTYDAQNSKNAYYGMALLSDGPFLARALGDPNLSNFTDLAKFFNISNVPSEATATAGLAGEGQDVSQFVSSGPMQIAGGSADSVAFALVAGSSLQDLLTQTQAAQHIYDCNIKGTGPVQPFQVSDQGVPQGEPVFFADQNLNATSWLWDFGDGNSSNQQNPQHSYAKHGTYEVSLTVSDGVCDFSSTQTVKVGFATNLEDWEQSNFSIFPNPSTGRLDFQTRIERAGKYEATVSDLMGRTVWQKSWTLPGGDIRKEINLHALPAGIYVFQFGDESLRQKTLLELR